MLEGCEVRVVCADGGEDCVDGFGGDREDVDGG